MLSRLKSLFRNTAAYDFYNGLRYRLEWLLWAVGRLERAPHLLKRRVIAQRARDFRPQVFVETGTLFGDMTHAQRNNFRRLFSIELDDYLFERASRRFRRFPHIRILHGDSGQKIAEVLRGLDEPCLFWLDAHYSGGITAHGDRMTPVFDEIRHILSHPVKSHVIVIDDARLFNGTDGYPTFRELQNFACSIDRNCKIWIENDTITVARYAQ
jgi:hypothetical protein